MLRRQWIRVTPGRRGALVGASAAVVCLGSALVACGAGDGGGGYVAVQHPASGPAVAPTGDVELIPLDPPTSASESAKGAAGNGTSGAADTRDDGSGTPAPGAGTASDAPGGGRTTSPGDADSGRTDGSSGSGTPTVAPSATPATPTE